MKIDSKTFKTPDLKKKITRENEALGIVRFNQYRDNIPSRDVALVAWNKRNVFLPS